MSTQSLAPQQIGGPRRERFAIGTLLVLYLISALGFAVATPYGEAPDEYAHLLYIEHLVRFGTLPPIVKDPYTYEAMQPPLYYLTGAAIVLIGREIRNTVPRTAPLTPPVQGNPAFQSPRHSDMVLLHPTDQRWLLWPLVLRGYSILLGLGVVVLTYLTARVLVPPPAPAAVPLIATAFAALIPQANFIRASVSNENLADLIASWMILLLALHLTRPYSGRRVLWLGVAYGLGLLTKLILAPLLVLIIPVLWWRRPRPEQGRVGRDLLWAGMVPVLLAGPLFLSRWIDYGDPLATRASRAMLGEVGLSLGKVVSETFRWQVWSSFWGVFGWQTIWMPSAVYFGFAVLTVLGIIGGGYLVVRRVLTRAQQAAYVVLALTVLLMYIMLGVVSLFTVVWQGREMYPALGSACVLLGFGLAGLLLGPGAVRIAEPIVLWRRRLAQGLIPALVLSLFALNVYSIVWLVLPALNPL